MQILELRLGLAEICLELGVDVSVRNLEKGGRSWSMWDLDLLISPRPGQNVWCPAGAQAIAEGNGLVIQLGNVIAEPTLDDLVSPCSWLPPYPKMLEKLWAILPDPAPRL